MTWKATIKFGSKYKKGYTYTGTNEFKTKKEAQDDVRLKKRNAKKEPHVKIKSSITKIRQTTKKTKKSWF